MFTILSIIFCLVVYITLDLMDNKAGRKSDHEPLKCQACSSL